jgi:hypothetical protein
MLAYGADAGIIGRYERKVKEAYIKLQKAEQINREQTKLKVVSNKTHKNIITDNKNMEIVIN